MCFSISDHLRFVPGHMAADINGAGHSRDMGRHSLYIQSDGRRLSAESLWAYSQFVDLLQHFLLKISVKRIPVLRIDGTHQGFFCQEGCLVKGSADSYSYH